MFLTGEFSRLTQVSKRLLHYYDAIGLLKPAYIDEETGYRYYSAKQLPQLNKILALKDLGLSLEQIQKMLQENISNKELQGMLILKKAEMEQIVLEDMQRLRRIQARLKQSKTSSTMPEIVVKSIPSQAYLSVRSKFSNPDEMLQLIDQMLRLVPDQAKPNSLGNAAGVFYSEDFSPDNNDVELGFFLKKPIHESIVLSESHTLEATTLPAVETMATLVQIGNPDLEFISLGKIASWIENNGYKITGPFREILFDIASLSDLANAVIELQVPVQKHIFPFH